MRPIDEAIAAREFPATELAADTDLTEHHLTEYMVAEQALFCPVCERYHWFSCISMSARRKHDRKQS